MKISQAVIEVLDRANISGNQLMLAGQLDRDLYQQTNKVLEAIGGKWNKSAKAHVFDGPVAAVLDPIMETGEYSRTKQDFGQFDTPPAVVARLIELAGGGLLGKIVLEPSAGVGNIVLAIERAGGDVTAHEIDMKRYTALKDRAQCVGGIHLGDFLLARPNPVYDLVAMNPPFAAQADIVHVLHAAKFLRPGGGLVSVMSAGVLFRDNRRAADFREFVSRGGGAFEKLPPGSFSVSGTDIHTCIVSFNV